MSSASARLRAFSSRLSGFVPPNRRLSPKNAKSAAPVLPSFSADTLGGRVHKKSYRTHSRARANSPDDSARRRGARDDGFQPNESPPSLEKVPRWLRPRVAADGPCGSHRPIPNSRAQRDDFPCYHGSLRVPDSAAITPLARTQQRLPMVPFREQPHKRQTPVRRFIDRKFNYTGNFRHGREWRLNLQP